MSTSERTAVASVLPASAFREEHARNVPPPVRALAMDLVGLLRAKATVISLLAGTALIVITTVGNLAALSHGKGNLVGLPPSMQAHQVIGSAFLMGLFAAAGCALAVVRDVRNGLGALTLRLPRRWPLVAVRAATATAVGVVFTLAGTAAAVAAGALSVQLFDQRLSLLSAVLPSLGGILAAVIAQSMIGSFVGWLLPRGGPAVLLLIAWIVIAEPALLAAWPRSAHVLLSGGSAGLMNDVSVSGRPGAWLGLGIAVVWTAALALLASICISRRDVPSNTLDNAA